MIQLQIFQTKLRSNFRGVILHSIFKSTVDTGIEETISNTEHLGDHSVYSIYVLNTGLVRDKYRAGDTTLWSTLEAWVHGTLRGYLAIVWMVLGL